MSREALKPGMAFHLDLVEDGFFLFDQACTIFAGEGLYRRFNRVGALLNKTGIVFL